MCAPPVDDWLAARRHAGRTEASPVASQRLRDFAVQRVQPARQRQLPGLCRLERRAGVWNVVAAPDFSLTLEDLVFPGDGLRGLRGDLDGARPTLGGGETRAEDRQASV